MKAHLLVGALVACALHVFAEPHLGYIYPCSIQAGTTNRFLIGGQRLQNVRGLWISGKGVTCPQLDVLPPFPSHFGLKQYDFLDAWLRNAYAGTPTRPPLPAHDKLRTWTRHRYFEQIDQLTELQRAVTAHRVYEPRNTLQDVPSLRESVFVTLVAERDAAAGKRWIALYDSYGISTTHVFFVTVEPHVRDAPYTPRYATPATPPPVTLPVVLDGRITAHNDADVFALRLKAGRVTCALTGRELVPFIGDAVPGYFNPVLRLTDGAGHTVATADDFHYLPDPVLACVVPSNGVYHLEVRDNLFRGRNDFVYSILCQQDAPRETQWPRKRAFAVYPRPVVHTPPSATNGVWREEGCVRAATRETFHDFTVRTPGERQIALYARRLGSPLDGVVRLYDSDGKTLATWDDVTNDVHVGSILQDEIDPVGRHNFKRAGRYRLGVRDATGASGPTYRYTLTVTPVQADFEVYALRTTHFFGRNSPNRSYMKLRIVRRNGFAGAIRLDEKGDFRFEPSVIPAQTNMLSVALFARRRTWHGMTNVTFTASAKTADGQRIVREIVPADKVEQAFAYTHFLTRPKFRLWLTPPKAQAGNDWPEMPDDTLFGRHIPLDYAALSLPADARAFDALTQVDVPLAPLPDNADDATLLARFAASAAKFPRTRRVALNLPLTVAYADAEKAEEYADYAALAGINRFASRDDRFVDDTPRLTRTFGRTRRFAEDNDVLLLIPDDATAPLAGALGSAARRLRAAGWCFDFVSTAALPASPGRYRMLVVPAGTNTDAPTLQRKLSGYPHDEKFTLVHDDGTLDFRTVQTTARREPMADCAGLRLARWQNGWYFVLNDSAEPIAGEWRFATRDPARHLMRYDIATGETRYHAAKPLGCFTFSLHAGDGVWLHVTR